MSMTVLSDDHGGKQQWNGMRQRNLSCLATCIWSWSSIWCGSAGIHILVTFGRVIEMKSGKLGREEGLLLRD
jgi:hypothetical protein